MAKDPTEVKPILISGEEAIILNKMISFLSDSPTVRYMLQFGEHEADVCMGLINKLGRAFLDGWETTNMPTEET